MFTDLHPLTEETIPFPTSANILARYAHDGVSYARLIVSREEGDGTATDWEYGSQKGNNIRRST